MSEKNSKAYHFLNGGEITLLKDGKKVNQPIIQAPLPPPPEPKQKRQGKPAEKVIPKTYVNLKRD